MRSTGTGKDETGSARRKVSSFSNFPFPGSLTAILLNMLLLGKIPGQCYEVCLIGHTTFTCLLMQDLEKHQKALTGSNILGQTASVV